MRPPEAVWGTLGTSRDALGDPSAKPKGQEHQTVQRLGAPGRLGIVRGTEHHGYRLGGLGLPAASWGGSTAGSTGKHTSWDNESNACVLNKEVRIPPNNIRNISYFDVIYLLLSRGRFHIGNTLWTGTTNYVLMNV